MRYRRRGRGLRRDGVGTPGVDWFGVALIAGILAMGALAGVVDALGVEPSGRDPGPPADPFRFVTPWTPPPPPPPPPLPFPVPGPGLR